MFLSFSFLKKPAIAGFFISASTAWGNNSPSLEVGIGIATQILADYRGSHRYSPDAIALPYAFFRGKIFKIDQRGARGEFLKTSRWELNLSLDGSLSVGDERNEERRGMPELDSSVEIGPSFNINLTGENFDEGWSMRLPVRAVFTVSPDNIESIGFVSNPRLTWRKPNVGRQWRISINTGPLFASRHYHAYFYDVEQRFTLPDRPVYQSTTGYSGWTNRVSFSRLIHDWRVAIAVRYDALDGATFEDSPLVKTEHYGAITFAVARRIWAR